jgi:hypothetical protein
MLGQDVKEGNAQTAAIQKFLWVMMPGERKMLALVPLCELEVLLDYYSWLYLLSWDQSLLAGQAAVR